VFCFSFLSKFPSFNLRKFINENFQLYLPCDGRWSGWRLSAASLLYAALWPMLVGSLLARCLLAVCFRTCELRYLVKHHAARAKVPDPDPVSFFGFSSECIVYIVWLLTGGIRDSDPVLPCLFYVINGLSRSR
jgi:hypothetical protein